MPIIEKIKRFLLSKKNGWFILLIVLLVLLFLLQTTRKYVKFEGFQQKEPFTIQRGSNVYDEFYSEIYDRLHNTETRSEKEAVEIINATQPDKTNSHFLDIGCGTGCLVNALKQKGYTAVGIDKSSAMIQTGCDRHPDIKMAMKCGNALDAMTFERGMFTHILCMDRTIYEIEDKITFLRNCKHWLQPGGYLFLHLVEPSEFNAIVPLGQPRGLLKDTDELKMINGKRITDTAIDFIDFTYNSSYDFSQYDKSGVVVQIEKFVDATTNNVRQNEHTYSMRPSRSILEDARYCGFVLNGQFISTEDKYQKVYILKAL